jgi:anti-sigma regulatory factor (Ser/Thr protein kinase)
MTDEITLTLPREPDFQRVTHLVLGGLAVRLNFTLETLEDLQLALDSLLERDDGDHGNDVTVRMTLTDDTLEALVGPLGERVLAEIDEDAGNELRLRRVLESTVDDVRIDGDSVRLTKKVGDG